MTKKGELVEAYYCKKIANINNEEEITIQTKAETTVEALDLFRKIKKEMSE